MVKKLVKVCSHSSSADLTSIWRIFLKKNFKFLIWRRFEIFTKNYHLKLVGTPCRHVLIIFFKIAAIVTAFGGGKSLEFSRFKELSHQYKEDQIDSSTYLANCNALLSNDVGKLESFMADLIVLLPQIRKQQVGHLLKFLTFFLLF